MKIITLKEWQDIVKTKNGGYQLFKKMESVEKIKGYNVSTYKIIYSDRLEYAVIYK